MADATMVSRRRPLYTCAASTLTIIWNLYGRALETNGSIGSGTRCLAKLGSRASPLICVVQYQWLSILWFVDGFILLMEKIFERCVPPSSHVFDKLDNVIDKVDNLPTDFELLMNRLQVNTPETTRDDRIVLPSMKCPYKEASEKGEKEEEKTEEIIGESDNHDGVKEDGNGKGNEKNEDPLLELFDFGWETPLTILRSAS